MKEKVTTFLDQELNFKSTALWAFSLTLVVILITRSSALKRTLSVGIYPFRRQDQKKAPKANVLEKKVTTKPCQYIQDTISKINQCQWAFDWERSHLSDQERNVLTFLQDDTSIKYFDITKPKVKFALLMTLAALYKRKKATFDAESSHKKILSLLKIASKIILKIDAMEKKEDSSWLFEAVLHLYGFSSLGNFISDDLKKIEILALPLIDKMQNFPKKVNYTPLLDRAAFLQNEQLKSRSPTDMIRTTLVSKWDLYWKIAYSRHTIDRFTTADSLYQLSFNSLICKIQSLNLSDMPALVLGDNDHDPDNLSSEQKLQCWHLGLIYTLIFENFLKYRCADDDTLVFSKEQLLFLDNSLQIDLFNPDSLKASEIDKIKNFGHLQHCLLYFFSKQPILILRLLQHHLSRSLEKDIRSDQILDAKLLIRLKLYQHCYLHHKASFPPELRNQSRDVFIDQLFCHFHFYAHPVRGEFDVQLYQDLRACLC